jgi:hypothetical protein
MNEKSDSLQSRNSIPHLAGPAVLVIILLLLTLHAGRSGFASLLAVYAAQNNNLAAANQATRLNAADADPHYVSGTILEASDLSQAIAEHQKAALARPDDYALWLSLARARELKGETDSAILAARQAIPLAPYYAQPHYQLGNILLRAGRSDEAFRELRLAGEANPTLMPGVIDLAWKLSGGRAQFVEQAIEPATPQSHIALGEFFRRREEVDAAIAMYIAAGAMAEQNRRSYLAELITAKRFPQAARLWAVGRAVGVTPGVIRDPGFEQEGNLNEPGFGWRSSDKLEGLHLSLDLTGPREGRSSLKIEFNGASDPASPLVSQLVLVEPNAHYQLHFAVRTEAIVSGGVPAVMVMDAITNSVVGQSGELPRTTGGWRDYTVDFVSGANTNAVQVELLRRGCDGSPCPIFGRLWLDNFSLQKMTTGE